MFIEAEGQKVAMTGPVTETERRNTETGLRGQVFDRKRRDENAGVRSGYVEMTGVGAASEKAKRERQDRERRAQRNADYMMLLQAQIAQLDREIAALDKDIWNVLADHMSADEMAYLRGIEDKEQQAREQMRLMREKLERGDITQEQFNNFSTFWDLRAEKQEQKAEFVDVMNNGTPEQQKRVLEEAGIDTLMEGRRSLDESKKQKVEKVIGDRDDVGDAVNRDTNNAFSALGSTNLFGGSPDASSHASVASKLLPESTLGEGSIIKASDHFGVAAHQPGPSPDVVRVALDTTAPDKTPPLPSPGTGPGATV